MNAFFCDRCGCRIVAPGKCAACLPGGRAVFNEPVLAHPAVKPEVAAEPKVAAVVPKSKNTNAS